jgi:amidophosphoribosyltransferase
MCGIVGIVSQEPVASALYDSLIHLQHRGQDAAGILTYGNRFYSKHGLGLVREIFVESELAALKGNMGIGHTRYPTAGGYGVSDIQPLWIGSPRGIALAHNGNLVNYQALADEIRLDQHAHLNSTLDSEVLLHLLANQLAMDQYPEQNETQFFQKLCHSVNAIFSKIIGSYSVLGLVIGKGLIAFRDPHGIRPLVIGEKMNASGKKDYIFASETTAFYTLGFTSIGDLQPGEVAYVSETGQLYRQVLKREKFSPCVFEYVYFARPDSVIDDVNVHHARLCMGRNLAKKWHEQFPDKCPDVIAPVPFTGNTAALAFAREISRLIGAEVNYSEALYKNPFIGRTFIMPNQQARSRNVRYKLTPQRSEIENKKVLIVDDSIVRGTTSKEIVKMIREFGAKEIYLVSTAPPIMHPCFYGIDIPSRAELIAADASEEQIREYLGVDCLLYQTQEDLVEAVTPKNLHQVRRPCMACMDGVYVCGQLTEKKIRLLKEQRLLEQEGSK